LGAKPVRNLLAGPVQHAGLPEYVPIQLLEIGDAVRDINEVTSNIAGAVEQQDAATRDLLVGYFGASTGAAAALVAEAAHEGPIAAIVSRGGRPDLAGPALSTVSAPTLLIVGGDDVEVLALNRAALAALRCAKQLVIVPGATHLFEEPGTLEAVVEHARGWFLKHFTDART